MSKRIPILVIEEDDDLRESIKSNLELDGFEVYTAENGLTGVEAACKYKLRLILLDVTEELEQVVSTLKHNFDTSHIPVIILIEADPVKGKRRAYEIGADNYITKPFADENLGEIVKLKLENCEAVIKGTAQKTKCLKRIPVLVIDDEDDIRKLIKYRLYSDGFEVYTAEDGPSGIKAARKYRPRLILLDVMMPGMDGLEVLLNLKWHKKTKHIPVFMLTAKNAVEDMDHAFSRRADDYLTKPFDGEKLGKTIKAKLEKLEQ